MKTTVNTEIDCSHKSSEESDFDFIKNSITDHFKKEKNKETTKYTVNIKNYAIYEFEVIELAEFIRDDEKLKNVGLEIKFDNNKSSHYHPYTFGQYDQQLFNYVKNFDEDKKDQLLLITECKYQYTKEIYSKINPKLEEYNIKLSHPLYINKKYATNYIHSDNPAYHNVRFEDHEAQRIVNLAQKNFTGYRLSLRSGLSYLGLGVSTLVGATSALAITLVNTLSDSLPTKLYTSAFNITSFSISSLGFLISSVGIFFSKINNALNVSTYNTVHNTNHSKIGAFLHPLDPKFTKKIEDEKTSENQPFIGQ
jgi:hypothetical protein